MSENSMIERARRRAYKLLIAPQPDDRTARRLALGRMLIIVLAVMGITIFSASERTSLGPPLKILLIIAVAVFTVEYTAKLWAAVEDAKYQRAINGRVRFAFTPWRIIELLTVLPFFVFLLQGSYAGLNALPVRLLYLFQLLLVFRLVKIRGSLDVFAKAWHSQKTALGLVFLGLWFLMLISASLLHMAENDAQPDAFGSIGASMYWAATTLTTVGYGDVVPITPAGRLLTSIISILGISAFAIPTGLVIVGFLQARKDLQGKPDTCPHCGKELEDGKDHEEGIYAA